MSAHRASFLSVAPLFVPGHVEKLRYKALEVNETLFVDLEDAVPSDQKAAARDGALALIVARPRDCVVRINALGDADAPSPIACEDIGAVMGPKLGGLVVPKVADGAMLRKIDVLMRAAEKASGLPPASVPLLVTIESARSVMQLADIARQALARPLALSFGMGDFAADMGIAWSRDEEESLVPRSLIPIASRASGLPMPFDSVFADVADDEGLRASAMRGKRLGYGGKPAIHPRQIPIIRSVYCPTEAELAWAQRVIAEAAAQQARGVGAFLVEGQMVDAPIIAQARRVIADCSLPNVDAAKRDGD